MTVRALLDHPVSHIETDNRGTRHYAFGTMPGRDGRPHEIALTIVGVGNNISAIATTQLLHDLPSVHTVILSGIAGGVPNTAKAEEHVRLGDIVVSNDRGVIQYDFVKEETGKIESRHPPRPASSNLFRAARMMEADALSGARPWDEPIEHALAVLNWKRPPGSTDLLAASDNPSVMLRHPKGDPLRIRRRPRVFVGPIASSNTLLKEPKRRDFLRDLFGVKAVEMEGSGTADAAWMAQAQHFVVRGICDYCDSRKGEDWQKYAAACAAGYVAALLRAIDPIEWTTGPASTRNSVRPERARPQSGRFGVSGGDNDTLRRIDETQSRLRSMQAEGSREASMLVPTISWIASVERKLHGNRVLAREVQALEAVHEEVHRTQGHAHHAGNRMSSLERLSLNLLERYESSPVLRANWEVRCAIGNSLTLAMSADSIGSRSGLITDMMQISTSRENWDIAQLLFDALQHAGLGRINRDYLMTVATEHEHNQVRWNVAAALKSIRMPTSDLRHIITKLLRDPSSWVVKELIDVGLRNQEVMAELETRENAAMVLELLEQDDQLLEHAVLSLRSLGRREFVPRFAAIVPGPGDDNPGSAGGQRSMAEDFRKVEELKAGLKGQHGKLYRAAERVVSLRIADTSVERKQSAILGYLHSTHDALAWASVRALFGGKLDECEDDFLTHALSDMLTSSSEWIRRECVEETLRLEDGRRKYLALRQIEAHRNELARVDEIRPYLVDIGMQFEG